MDNEEIRKLLQELKETSDESSAVRSKVVRIHIDTPEEAQRRKRAKEKAEEREARRLAEEQARAEEEAQARRLEAEKAAQEAVEEAKREAKAGFASDLEGDILSEQQKYAQESEEETPDLELSWEYERPELTSGFAREEDFAPSGQKRGEEASSKTGRKSSGEDDFDSDEADFRSEDPDASSGGKKERITTGLPGVFGSITDRVLSFAGGIRKSVKEDLSKAREHGARQEESSEETSTAPQAESVREETGDLSEADFALRPEPETEEDGDGPEAAFTPRTEPAPAGAWDREADGASGPDSDAFAKEDEPVSAGLLEEDEPEEEKETASGGREYGPDEEWKRLLDEPPKKKSRFRKFRLQHAALKRPEGMKKRQKKDKNVEEADPETEEQEQPRRIEVIDLNENQNNKESEVIPLDGSTGPLPAPADLKRESEKRTPAEEKPKKRRPLRLKKKQLILAAVILAAAAAVGVILFFVLGNMKNARRAQIEADDGLSIRILEQPDHFTDEGDVRIRAKAPETIQSITVNGENVVAEQGRSVEFTYHAKGGTLDIMAVSTDQVRSAKVVLAYVDSQPPVVTIREEMDGKIALSAEDSESGLDAIYVGSLNGLTQVPDYERYTESLDADPSKEISYYAKDQAGNQTTPVTVALTPAQSISFEKERFSLFPGTAERVSLVTTPEHAFVNNLTLEAENPKVVQVEGDMQIRGMAEGDTKITATADGIPGVMASVSVSGHRKVTISAIGDCTLGTDESFSQNNSFNAFESLYGDSYFFEKVKGILSADDSTFANFEGTLTTSTQREQKQFAFKGDPSYTQILLDGSVDVVSLANNHSKDYGEQSKTDTENILEEAGIEWCEGDHIAYRDLDGVLTAYIGIYALENGLDTLPQVKSAIAEAKEKGADLIIVEFHWGAELVTAVDEYQKELAHAAVDAGANLVLGSHAHVLLGIEKYNGVYIVYGLGNFCFGGSANPASYDTMIWQQTFSFSSDGLESEDDIAIIPCRVSSDLSANNYQPVPVSGDEAAAIMQTIDTLSAPFGQTYSQYMVDGTLWTDN